MAFTFEDLIKLARVPPEKKIDLRKDFDPGFSGGGWNKEKANRRLEGGVEALAERQDRLYAEDTNEMPIVLQALDVAGKDGTLKHVMPKVNSRGVNVTSFKALSSEEVSHDYLWRNTRAFPERGHIGIFNRSYYEKVLVTRVHPELPEKQNLPPNIDKKGLWEQRFEGINNFEKYLVNNGIIGLKFFLKVSEEEQKKCILERLDLPEKNWRFSEPDIRELVYWDDYLDAYEDLFNHTGALWAPWHVTPADRKRGAHRVVAAIIYNTLADLKVDHTTVSEEAIQELRKAKKKLEDEDEENPDDGAKNREKKHRKG